MNERDALILLDLVLLLMAMGWMLVALWRGVVNIELFYNYTYIVLMLFAMVLNVRMLKK
jgi:hypothetical protein|tara:strand:- start:18693 stop:18869 length:177 start_codon:yes stop_codon:yes gene_type:complete